MRDKLIGLTLVIFVAALIYFFGSKFRAGHDHPPAPDVAAASITDAEAPKSVISTTVDADVDASIANVTDDDAGASSPACLAMQTASQPKLDEAQDAGWCVDLSLADLGCKTSPNGATWGIRIDDVTDLEADAAACPTGWLERVVHVAADKSGRPSCRLVLEAFGTDIVTTCTRPRRCTSSRSSTGTATAKTKR